jgi:quinol monooxygenase YgiN
VLRHTQYKSGALQGVLPAWRNVVDYVTKEEPGTQVYLVAEDKEGGAIRTVEVFEDRR